MDSTERVQVVGHWLKLYDLHQARLADLETWRHRVTVTTFALFAGVLLGWHKSQELGSDGEVVVDFMGLLASGDRHYLLLLLAILFVGHLHCAWSQWRATVVATCIRRIERTLQLPVEVRYYRIGKARLCIYIMVSNATSLIVIVGAFILLLYSQDSRCALLWFLLLSLAVWSVFARAAYIHTQENGGFE